MSEHGFMMEAFSEAVAAGQRGECPVGAVLVRDARIIARAGNEELARSDATAHAEILCLRRGGRALGSHVLKGCTMYTTLWPCPMCQGAMLQAQVESVVAGATTFRWIRQVRFNEGNLKITGPVMQRQCRRLFVEWAQANGRLEILEMENPD